MNATPRLHPARVAPTRSRRIARRLSILAFSLLCLAGPAGAWSALGHRMVGALAERHVRPQTAREIRTLLAGEADPTLAGVATWADDLRNTDPERFKATSRWHYVNTPEDTCKVDLPRDCPDGQCVVGAIEAQRRILADRSQPIEARRDALKFLVHFVGDAHQPMHANHHPDKGGNDYQISLRTDLQPEAYARRHYVDGVMGTNLHSVWDYYVLASLGLKLPEYVARLDAQPWPPTAPVLQPEGWAGESCRLIDARGLYPRDANGRQSHTLDHAYLDAMRPLAEQRIRQAAWRLATLLDDALADGTPD